MNEPGPSDLEIQNLGQQVETLTQQLEQITIYLILVKDQRPVKTYIIHSTTVFYIEFPNFNGSMNGEQIF